MNRAATSKTFLVAIADDTSAAKPVYAIVADDPSDAITAVAEALGAPAEQLSLTGTLSRSLAKDMKLTPGEVRRV